MISPFAFLRWFFRALREAALVFVVLGGVVVAAAVVMMETGPDIGGGPAWLVAAFQTALLVGPERTDLYAGFTGRAVEFLLETVGLLVTGIIVAAAMIAFGKAADGE